MSRFILCCLFLTFFLPVIAQVSELKSEAQRLEVRFEPDTKVMKVVHRIRTHHAAAVPYNQLHLRLPEQEDGVEVAYDFQVITMNGQRLDAFFLENPVPSGSLLSLGLDSPLFPGEIFSLGLEYQVTLPASDLMDQVGVNADFAFVQNWTPRLLADAEANEDEGRVLETIVAVSLPQGWDVVTNGAFTVQDTAEPKNFLGFATDVPLLFLQGWPQETGDIEINGENKPISWWIRDPEFDFESLSVLIGVGLGHQNMHQHLSRIEGMILPSNWVADFETFQRAGLLVIPDDVSLDVVKLWNPEILDPLSHYLWTFPGRMSPFWQRAWVAYWKQTMKDRKVADYTPKLHPFISQFFSPKSQEAQPWQRFKDTTAFFLQAYQGRPPWQVWQPNEPQTTRLLEIERVLGKEMLEPKVFSLQETLRKQGTFISDTFIQIALFEKECPALLLDPNFDSSAVSASIGSMEQRDEILFFEVSQTGLMDGVLYIGLCFQDGSVDLVEWQVDSVTNHFEIQVSKPVAGIVLDPDFKFFMATQLKRVWPRETNETSVNPQLLNTWQQWLQMLLGGL